MLVNPVEMTQKARAEGYGIGCFSSFDYNSVEAIITAAEETNTPVIMGILDFSDENSPFKDFYMTKSQWKNFMRFVRGRAESSPVPVCVHLDHCGTFDGCIRAIQEGATSVMLDASRKSFEENVEITRKVVEAAHACGVAVEGEIGHIAGHPSAIDEIFTTVEDAVAYYEATGIDLLAASVGSVHGVLKTKPMLQFDLMKQLRDAVPCGIVMHGASGMTEEEYNKSVRSGIVKLNFASYLQISMANAMREKLAQDTTGHMFAQAVNRAEVAAGVEMIKKHIGYFLTKPLSAV